MHVILDFLQKEAYLMVSLTMLQWLIPVKIITLKDVNLKAVSMVMTKMNYLTIGQLSLCNYEVMRIIFGIALGNGCGQMETYVHADDITA